MGDHMRLGIQMDSEEAIDAVMRAIDFYTDATLDDISDCQYQDDALLVTLADNRTFLVKVELIGVAK